MDKSPQQPGDRTPGWPRAGAFPRRPGQGARRAEEGRSPGPAARRAHQQTDARQDRPPDRQGVGQTAARPLRLPGRNGFPAGRDRSREKGRRRRRRRPGEGEKREGAREQGGGARQAAGRRRKEEARGDGFPAGDSEKTHARPRHIRARGSRRRRGLGGGVTGHKSPAPHPAP